MSTTHELRRRRDAALRCPPLPDGRRDPLDPHTARRHRAPSTYGLTDRELQLHAAALLANGWSAQEVRQRLRLPPPRIAAGCICPLAATTSTPTSEAA